MNILLFGSSGFIGSQVTQRLLAQGYNVITPTSRDIDFTQPNALDLDKIKHLMQPVNVVINTVGVMSHDTALSQNSKRLMENVHHHTPFLLAKVAKSQGVQHWINLSALGANPRHEVAFVGTKGRGDAAILSLVETGNDERFRVSVVRPSLVFGRGNIATSNPSTGSGRTDFLEKNTQKGGASFEMFVKLAKLPILILPSGGKFDIQPVHIDDVAQGLVNLALNKNTQNLPPIFNFTGEKVITLAEYIGEIRLKFYQKNPPVILNLPMPLAKFFVRILQNFSDMVSVDSLVLLENGNVADNADFLKLLGHKSQTDG